MKINGQAVEAPVEEVLVLQRGNGRVVFLACAVDLDEFYALCPEPKPPGKITPEGWVPEPNDPGYRQIKANHNIQLNAYVVVHSLVPSKIEWDTVVLDNPSTWKNWRDDLKNNHFSTFEIGRIFQLTQDANCLNEEKLQRARELFLQGKAAALDASTSPNSEPTSMPSGEPVAA